VAAGRIDGFFEQGLAPWDVVAGQAIVEAAGGRVTDYAGQAHDPYGGHILASNDLIHGELTQLVRP
jgi:myo-inositol-1(or 4)-monophosphatase